MTQYATRPCCSTSKLCCRHAGCLPGRVEHKLCLNKHGTDEFPTLFTDFFQCLHCLVRAPRFTNNDHLWQAAVNRRKDGCLTSCGQKHQ